MNNINLIKKIFYSIIVLFFITSISCSVSTFSQFVAQSQLKQDKKVSKEIKTPNKIIKPNLKNNIIPKNKSRDAVYKKFPDSYSKLDKNKTVKIITEELIENTIETSRQKYIRGLICIQSGDTVEAIKKFEEALSDLNKLVSYPEIENNIEFKDLSQNIVYDYEKYASSIDINVENTLNMYISKERLFEAEVVKDDNSNIIVSEKTRKQGRSSDKFIFSLPDTTELIIPLIDNPAVTKQIDFLTKGRGRQFIIGWLKRSSRWYNMMVELTVEEGMPEEIIILPMIESAYNPINVSPKSAVGLWQFMYSTGLDYGLNKRESIWVDERRDPIKSTRAGLRYLRDMYMEFNDWHLTLVAYNWGWGNVRRALKQTNVENPTYWDLRTKKNIAMPTESQNYVPLFLALVKILSNPTEYGFDLEAIEYEPEFLYDVVEIRQATNLAAIATAIGVGIQEIRDLNTELLYDITPPDKKYYRLKVPPGTAKYFVENFDKLPLEEKQPYLTHKVAKGEDVISISEKYDVAIDELVTLNNLNGTSIALTSGTELRIPIGGKNYLQSTLVYTSTGIRPKTEVVFDNPNYHIVGTGESVYGVAAKYKISAANLRNWNKLQIDEEILKEGTILIISEEEAEKVNSSTSKKTIESLTYKNFNDNIKPANSNKKPVDNSKKIDNNKLYTVKAGDNLSKIAAENNCSINDIKKWNNLKDDKVMIGQVLNMDSISGNVKIKNEKNIEKTSNSNKTTKQKTKSYIVKKGDTLYDIAKKFDTSVSEIIKNNSTLDADKLQIGQKIKIK